VNCSYLLKLRIEHKRALFSNTSVTQPPTDQKVATGELYPEQAQIFHPYQNRGDGDVRANNIDSTLWNILFRTIYQATHLINLNK
jgi:hypothetical protein